MSTDANVVDKFLLSENGVIWTVSVFIKFVSSFFGSSERLVEFSKLKLVLASFS